MVHAQPGQRHRADKSRQLQRRLYRAAKRSRNRRFHALYDRMVRPDMLWRAWQEVRANGGSAGVDDIGSEDVECQGVDGYLQAIADDLKGGSCQPQPVLRVYIPKPDGRQRPLGIPTWSDKLLQEVIRLILEAYYEPQFSPHSHGFRSGRGCHTALGEITKGWKGVKWFIAGDISRCFDSLDHPVLLTILRESFHDQRFLRLITNLLKAGYLEEWRYHTTLSGVLQSSVVSPIRHR